MITNQEVSPELQKNQGEKECKRFCFFSLELAENGWITIPGYKIQKAQYTESDKEVNHLRKFCEGDAEAHANCGQQLEIMGAPKLAIVAEAFLQSSAVTASGRPSPSPPADPDSAITHQSHTVHSHSCASSFLCGRRADTRLLFLK